MSTRSRNRIDYGRSGLRSVRGCCAFWTDIWQLSERLHYPSSSPQVGCCAALPLSSMRVSHSLVRYHSRAELHTPASTMPLLPSSDFADLSPRGVSDGHPLHHRSWGVRSHAAISESGHLRYGHDCCDLHGLERAHHSSLSHPSRSHTGDHPEPFHPGQRLAL